MDEKVKNEIRFKKKCSDERRIDARSKVKESERKIQERKNKRWKMKEIKRNRQLSYISTNKNFWNENSEKWQKNKILRSLQICVVRRHCIKKERNYITEHMRKTDEIKKEHPICLIVSK